MSKVYSKYLWLILAWRKDRTRCNSGFILYYD